MRFDLNVLDLMDAQGHADRVRDLDGMNKTALCLRGWGERP